MRVLAIFGFVVTLLTMSAAAQPKVSSPLPAPPGWRFPRASEIKGQWSRQNWEQECRKAKEEPKRSGGDANEECWKPAFPVHTALGDFDGNGIRDEARILISTKKRGDAAIFIFLRSGSKKVNAVRVDTIYVLDGSPQNYFVGTQRAGEKLETACGKGYWDCGPAEPKAVTLKREGLLFGQFESWSAVTYWDSGRKRFKVVALSD